MPTKAELLETVCREFQKAQTGKSPKWKPIPGQISFPPSLHVANGQHLDVTEDLLVAVDEYAALLRQSSAALRSAFSIKDFRSVVSSSFGKALDQLGTVQPQPAALEKVLDAFISAEVDRRKRDTDLLLGCWLFEDASAYPIQIGPVRFQRRSVWLSEQLAGATISKTTFRRLCRTWNGDRPKRRKSGLDRYQETTILEAVGPCPIVCRVLSHGLSSELIVQKGLLTARMAMAALALVWPDSQDVLRHLNLIYDGSPRSRHYALMSDGGVSGSGTSISITPFGQHSKGSVTPALQQLHPTFDIVADALTAYLNPHAQVQRPGIANAIFLSLLWWHQACRENSDQVAVTAFAASLDALAGGGKAKGIKELIEARLGVAPSAILMKDGRTSAAVVDAIYNAARSRFIHGSSIDYVEDWTQLRTTAMVVTRLVFLHATLWLHQNPTVSEVSALRE